jgi:cell division protein FtsQ
MFKKIVHIVLWLIAIAIIAVSFGFSVKESRQLVCLEIKVDITDSSKVRFIRSNDIRNWVKIYHREIFGRQIGSFNIRKIEEGIEKLQAVEDVSVFTNFYNNGVRNSQVLVIRIKQREPVFRVMGSGSTWYVDRLGKYISWSAQFTPRVIIVGGNFSAKYAGERLLPLVTYINEDSFWSSQIDQIYVSGNGELSMIPRVGDQVIYFGVPEDYKVKFRNLKALYTEGFKSGGWNRYSTINAKFLNQIVCTKKNSYEPN